MFDKVLQFKCLSLEIIERGFLKNLKDTKRLIVNKNSLNILYAVK